MHSSGTSLSQLICDECACILTSHGWGEKPWHRLHAGKGMGVRLSVCTRLSRVEGIDQVGNASLVGVFHGIRGQDMTASSLPVRCTVQQWSRIERGGRNGVLGQLGLEWKAETIADALR